MADSDFYKAFKRRQGQSRRGREQLALPKQRRQLPVVFEGGATTPPPPSPFYQAFQKHEKRREALGKVAQTGSDGKSFTQGLITSTISSAAELFGAEPFLEAEEFRLENPWSGLASQIAGPTGVFGAVFKLSRLPKLLKQIDATVVRLGIDAPTRPILAGAARESIAFAPLEAARLGTGLVVTEDWDKYGNLLADVGLSVVLTGAFGGVFGLFRSGGKVDYKQGSVVSGSSGFHPAIENRIAEQMLKELPEGPAKTRLQQKSYELKEEALTIEPLKVAGEADARYVESLEGGSKKLSNVTNALFKTQVADTPTSIIAASGLDTRLLKETAITNAQTLNRGELAGFVEKAGFETIDELAKTLIYPRITKVVSKKTAKTISEALGDASAAKGLAQVGDGIFLGREPDGLFVVVKRVGGGSGAPSTAKGGSAPRSAGVPPLVSEDDIFLVAKTDKPQKIIPSLGNITEGTVKAWSLMREPFKPDPASNNIFHHFGNEMLNYFNAGDISKILNSSKKDSLQHLQKTLVTKGLENGTAEVMANVFYNSFQPTVFKQVRDADFGRLFGLLSASMQKAESLVNGIFHGRLNVLGSAFQAGRGKNITRESMTGYTPLEELIRSLDADELQAYATVAIAKEPAKAAKQLLERTDVSPRVKNAVKESVAINKDVIEKVLLPVLRDAGKEHVFEALQGYIFPRIYRGDFFIEVKNEEKGLVFLASGKNPAEAQQEAAIFVSVAKEVGKDWTAGKVQSFSARTDVSTVKNLDDLIAQAMNSTDDTVEIIQKGLGRIAETGEATPGIPSTLTQARTGVGGSPDVRFFSTQEVLDSTKSHYNQIIKFAAYTDWQTRWGEFANITLKQNNPTAFADLQKKAGQFLGVEGAITNALNKTLKPLAPLLGGEKAATRIAGATNKLLYDWQLGFFNLNFAMLNYLTPLQTTLPHLHFTLKAPTADVAALYNLFPRLNSNGQAVGVFGEISAQKLFSEGWRVARDPDLLPASREFYSRAFADGTLGNSINTELMNPAGGVPQKLKETWEQRGGFAFIADSLRFLANDSERFARATSFGSGLVLGSRVYKLEGEALYQFAKKTVELTQYAYRAVDRPNVFTGPIGSTFGLFKNWQFHFINTMAMYAGVAVKDKVWAPMLWQMATATALAGIGGTPLRNVANGLAQWHEKDQTGFQWMQENWGQGLVGDTTLGDTVYYGLPAFLGVSLQTSAAIPGTDVRNEVNSLMSSVLLSRGAELGGALSDAIEEAQVQGHNPLRQDKIRNRLIAASSPRAVARIVQAVEGDRIRSLRSGNPIIQDVSPSARFLHGIGFNSVEVGRVQTASNELYKDREARRVEIQSYGQAFADAIEGGDSEQATKLLREAAAKGLPMDSVLASMRTRGERERGDNLDRFDKARLYRVRQALER